MIFAQFKKFTKSKLRNSRLVFGNMLSHYVTSFLDRGTHFHQAEKFTISCTKNFIPFLILATPGQAHTYKSHAEKLAHRLKTCTLALKMPARTVTLHAIIQQLKNISQ